MYVTQVQGKFYRVVVVELDRGTPRIGKRAIEPMAASEVAMLRARGLLRELYR